MDHNFSIVDFEILFKKHNKFLNMISFQIVKDPDLAKDIVQDFFLNFWQKRHELLISGTFLAYATRAIKNRSISYMQRKPFESSTLQQLDDLADADQLEAMEFQLAKEKLDLKVSSLIELLPADRKKIFMAYVVDGLSYSAIAEKYGISVNTVKTQMKRAYAFMKEHSKDQSLDLLIVSILFANMG